MTGTSPARNHSPEPWTLAHDNGIQSAVNGPQHDRSGKTSWVAGCYSNDLSSDEIAANQRRIIACVNACAGIPTDRLMQLTNLASAIEDVDDRQGNIDCADYCSISRALQIEDHVENAAR